VGFWVGYPNPWPPQGAVMTNAHTGWVWAGWSYNMANGTYEHPSGAEIDSLVVHQAGSAAVLAQLQQDAIQAAQAQHQALQQQFSTSFNTTAGFGGGAVYSDFHDPAPDTSELMQASDVVEKFVKFMKEMGVKEPMELPGTVFVAWLVYEAGVREDNGRISEQTRKVLVSIEEHPDVVKLIERDNPDIAAE